MQNGWQQDELRELLAWGAVWEAVGCQFVFENRIGVQKYSSPIILCQIKYPKYRKHGVSGGLKMAVLVCINNARL